jgi:release factor glutamine methyltransferase
MTVEQALQRACGLGVDRLDAALLLAHHLGRSRAWVIAHARDPVDAERLAPFDADCRQRADDVPLAYLIGRREFMGLELRVTRDVLVPRPETETLALWAIELLQQRATARPRVIDLGTGSGALALAIAAACPQAQVTAIDCSAAALDVARSNAERLGLPLRLVQSDWWQALDGAVFDLAVANPPYVAEGDAHLRALRHEPQAALVAGADGLDALRQIFVGASGHVDGWLLVEHGWTQATAVQNLMRDTGFSAIQTRADLAGHARCAGGRVT